MHSSGLVEQVAGTGHSGAAGLLTFSTMPGAGILRALYRKVLDYFRLPPDRRQYFDEDVASDQWDLLESAALLQVTEFKVFELAYKAWYGVAARQTVIEAHFSDYMFRQIIPVWVAGFCRRVVEMEQAGNLNPRDFGIYQRLPNRRMALIGKTYAALLLAAFLVLFVMAYGEQVAELLSDGTRDTAGLPQHNTMP